MSKGLEALANIVDEIKYTHSNGKVLTDYDKEQVDIIQKELQALEIIKNKKVNLFKIWVYDDYEQYKYYYPFGEYHAIEAMLTLEEFELIKEVVGEWN